MCDILKTSAAAIVLAAGLVGTALAQEAGRASTGDGGSPRAADTQDYTFGRARPAEVPKVDGKAESRAAPITDEAKAVEAFTVLSRSRDGKETRTAPSDALKSKVIDMLNAPAEGTKPQSGTKKTSFEADPALTEGDEADRQVFGDDDRVPIKNTKVYPFTAIGYIEGKTKDGYASCSGTLIGPRTVITAAHCLYSNEAKAWLDEIVFIPALNGADVVPFGGFEYDTLSIVEGFATNYDANIGYGSVVPWDLGIITLAQPIGDNLGWLGYNNFPDLGDFDANIVGYPGDKPGGTMWRATCGVRAENVDEGLFYYDCDTYPGSSGSSVYAYDNTSKERVIVGVNVAESPEANVAVRLNATYIEWVNGLWK